jgi:hypothetical protein
MLSAQLHHLPGHDHQRELVRSQTRNEIDGWINAIFKTKERTFEGVLIRNIARGMSKDEALVAIINNSARSNATVDIIAGYR